MRGSRRRASSMKKLSTTGAIAESASRNAVAPMPAGGQSRSTSCSSPSKSKPGRRGVTGGVQIVMRLIDVESRPACRWRRIRHLWVLPSPAWLHGLRSFEGRNVGSAHEAKCGKRHPSDADDCGDGVHGAEARLAEGSTVEADDFRNPALHA